MQSAGGELEGAHAHEPDGPAHVRLRGPILDDDVKVHVVDLKGSGSESPSGSSGESSPRASGASAPFADAKLFHAVSLDHAGSLPPKYDPRRFSLVAEAARRLRSAGFDHGRSYLTFRNVSFSIKASKASRETRTLASAFGNPFRRAEKRTVDVLKNVTGCVVPGSATLLLGGPRSGKTTLLKILARQTADLSEGTISGEILLNGEKPDRAYQRRVALVEQSDEHYPLLTVREAMEFSARLRAPREMSHEQVSDKVTTVLKSLNLSHVADTIVGNQAVRGISGGERRRLTVGLEGVASGKSAVLMDQASDGLDATATLDLCRALRTLADEGVAVLACLLQPSWEAFCCFDQLMMLAGGRVVYQGPAQEAVRYFCHMGYRRPHGMPPQDFLQWVTEKPGEEFWHGKGPAPTPAQLADAFAASEEARRVEAAVGEALAEGRALAEPPAPLRGEYAQPFWFQFWMNYVRFSKLLVRDKAPNIGRFVMQMVFMAFITGTLYVSSSDTYRGAMNRVAFLQAAALGFGFAALSKIERFFNDRAMLYKEDADRYYRPAAWFLAIVLADVPRLFLEVLVYAFITYWTVGLQSVSSSVRFGKYILALFSMTMTADATVLAISAWNPTLTIGAIFASIVPAILLLFNGFLVPREKIPKPWIWVHYLTFYRYPHEALCINELHDLKLRDTPEGGAAVLNMFDMHTDPDWYWYCELIMLGQWVAYASLAALGYGFKRWRKQYVTPEDAGSAGGAATVDVVGGVDDGSAEGGADNNDNGSGSKGHFSPPRALLTFKNLSYSVPDPNDKKQTKTLLNGVTGYCRSGDLVALMGPSGGGKTTLLDVLADRKTGGSVEGDLLVNKRPRDRTFLRMSGYVEQFDLLFSTMTIREAIQTSATLRLDESVPHEEKLRAVEAAIDALHLRKHAGEVIGTLAAGGISVAMRKRVCIAMELVPRPSLLFLDEPTTGLDAASALQIVTLLRELAGKGQAIICTIHQPSAEIFRKFDSLLLLKKGGEVTYFGKMGEDADAVLSYFEGLGFPRPHYRNPADHVLDVVMGKQTPAGAAAAAAPGAEPAPLDFAKAWRESKEAAQRAAELDELVASYDIDEAPFKHRSATGLAFQTRALMRRKLRELWRSPTYVLAKILSNVVMGFVVGTMFADRGADQANARMRNSLVFLMIMYTMKRAVGDVPSNFAAREIYYRERSQGMYRPAAHWASSFLVGTPFNLANLVVFLVMVYWIAGLNPADAGQRFAYALLVLWLFQLTATAFNEMLSYLLPVAAAAQAMAGFFIAAGSFFAGFMIPASDMPRPWIWAYYFFFMHYPVESMVTNEMQGMEFTGCTDALYAKGMCYKTGDDAVASFGFSYDNRYLNLIWLAVFFVGFELIKGFAIHRIVHLKR
eukprot:tig00000411_g556.t1